MYKYYDPSRAEKIKSASKDITSQDLHWSGKLLRDYDPLKPSKFNFLNLLDLLEGDEAEILESLPELADVPYRDILDKIKYDDSRTDHSIHSLNSEQKTEIALFHSFK